MKKKKDVNEPIIAKRKKFDITDSSICFLFSLIMPALVSLCFIIIFAIFSSMSGSNYNEFIQTELALSLIMLYPPFVFFFIYLIYNKKNKIDYMVASNINFKVDWLKVLIVLIISVVSVFLVSPFISLLDYTYSLMGYSPDNSLPYVMNNGWKYIFGVLTMAIFPAVCEELLYRGLIFKGLNAKFNPHIAICLSALMFTLLHGSLQQTVYQFLLGLMLGYAMYYGKSIIYPILLHFVNNFIVVSISFYYTMNKIDVNNKIAYNNAWQVIYPILLFLVAVGVVVCLIYLLKLVNDKNKKNKEESIKKVLSNLENDENNSIDNNIIVNEIVNSSAAGAGNVVFEKSTKLTKKEKILLYGSIALGVIIWFVNTIMVIKGA